MEGFIHSSSIMMHCFVASCRKDYLLDLVGAKGILHA
ncbi:hypothetical protein RHABOEDO_001480 [Candidatus Rhabdochlamydia oedothoracis]|uniref:Uncharacterized protein n=1 Tax=Candidatus Rhabdochlamydia oedothoracis TaxID=2720720 RepID=A0ABX8V6W0_9BACT|nr:hypothetical protein RHOW815_001424 [Candidatus Rhabdochlamydia sp. W815]QYF49190.1 hypothetical protein RHABOEDO_001480 [Candidatus Rhabdochlamydia oedothoracis]